MIEVEIAFLDPQTGILTRTAYSKVEENAPHSGQWKKSRIRVRDHEHEFEVVQSDMKESEVCAEAVSLLSTTGEAPTTPSGPGSVTRDEVQALLMAERHLGTLRVEALEIARSIAGIDADDLVRFIELVMDRTQEHIQWTTTPISHREPSDDAVLQALLEVVALKRNHARRRLP